MCRTLPCSRRTSTSSSSRVCTVSSRLLEYETDWYKVIEIILSRLQEDKERVEVIASRDLECWAKMQSGGNSLNLKNRVVLEKIYFEPPAEARVQRQVLHPGRS